jgi:acetylornithine deacetylase/succinyl-diaminopimelate desuccinylase-like protein
MGHTDVGPVNPDGWSRDPFSGDIDDDGFVWGRGAVDMLNITASQAVSFRNLATSGFTPKGTLVYLAVADEEALGTWGARYLVEHERDAVYADYVLTESGGYQMPTTEGVRLPVLTAE